MGELDRLSPYTVYTDFTRLFDGLTTLRRLTDQTYTGLTSDSDLNCTYSDLRLLSYHPPPGVLTTYLTSPRQLLRQLPNNLRTTMTTTSTRPIPSKGLSHLELEPNNLVPYTAQDSSVVSQGLLAEVLSNHPIIRSSTLIKEVRTPFYLECWIKIPIQRTHKGTQQMAPRAVPG